MQSRPAPKRYLPKRKITKLNPSAAGTPGYTLEPYQVVLRPLVTEKGTHQSTRHNAFNFQVHVAATKPEIKAAIQALFPVRVLSVNTQIRMGKTRNYKNSLGKLPDWKKAVVTLHEDDKIDFF